MPKDNSERIIDWPYSAPSSRSGSTSIGTDIGGGGGASNLNALTDVTISSPVNGNLLQYNSTSGQWVNVVPPSGVGAMNLNDLGDVTLTSQANKQTLQYNSGTAQWVNLILPFTDLNFTGSSLTSIANRNHSLLTGIGPDDHHAQHHNIVGTDHTVTGAAFTVVGVNPANTVALLPTSSSPGASQSVLRTDTTGGLQLDTTLFYVDATNNRIGVNVTPGAGPLGGAAALDIRASATGDITQRIRQISGQTQRLWRVEDVAGNELIVMDSVGNLQSGTPGFVSGLSGWQITYNGNAEFNNIWARGELHATVFVKDEVHATGGTFFVATAGTLHDDATIDNSTATIENFQVTHKPGASQVTDDLTIETTSSTFSGTTLQFQALVDFLNINDPPSGPAFYFNAGDTLRSKTEVPTGVTDFWLTVNGGTQMDGFARYGVFKQSGTNGVLPKGAAVVSYGQVGAGRILMTSDLNYAPYIDIFSVGPNVWTANAGAVIPRVRIGRLDGVGIPGAHLPGDHPYHPGDGLPGITGIEQYGMVAGTDLSSAASPYFVASNLQFKLYKINITLNNGTNDTALITQDGNLTLGSNIGVTAGKSFQVFATAQAPYNAGDVLIGKAAGNYMKWDQNAGLLTINGSLQVGGTDAKTYIDNADNTTATNANAYTDSSRLEGVTGTFTVTGQQSLMWTGVTLRFAGGPPASINNSAANPGLTGLTVRTWLYWAFTTSTLQTTTDLTTIGPQTFVVAVFDPGLSAGNPGSLTIVGGSTYISGNNIVTGSIVAANIQVQTITAGYLSIGDLSAIKGTFASVNTGNLGVNGNLVMTGSTGKLYSTTKSDFTQTVAGFFLGWDTNSTSAYKFIIGDANSHLSWDGTRIDLRTTQPITIVTSSGSSAIVVTDNTHTAILAFGYDTTNALAFLDIGGGSLRGLEARLTTLYVGDGSAPSSFVNMINFRALGGVTNALQYNNNGILNYNGNMTTSGTFQATGQILTNGNSIRIGTEKSSGITTSLGTPAGGLGEIAWAQGFIYVYTGTTNGWRRATMNSF